MRSDDADCSTQEAAQRLRLAARSVQQMVDRGELEAWKTPGGHRRISVASVDRWLEARGRELPSNAPAASTPAAGTTATVAPAPTAARPKVLVIDDSRHYQNLVALLVRQRIAGAELHLADDGVAGLALAGRLAPDILIVDPALPSIDAAALLTGLRSHALFARSRLIVVTALDEPASAPYAFALEGMPVAHKSRLASELPPLLDAALAREASPS